MVFGPRHPVRAEGRIVTACMQDHDGRIVVSGEEAPGVIVVCDEGLTPAEAREMAERLIDAARLAETWTVTWNRDLKRKSGLAHPCRNAQAAQR
ncbi:hypothetical protein AO501_04675 [Mycobacterium gordonae]|uniref:Uncharacterized protein n=1 Tax=Mycobacterium gordonae TaxID=1778 RepID=A0A0Q2M7Q1_MYCGO|nr:hypothetical protein AO501_04675 [Mycobacterium gordonae]